MLCLYVEHAENAFCEKYGYTFRFINEVNHKSQVFTFHSLLCIRPPN
ncbi:protein of unknown function [Xenorhabdus poinarii G6]|uniref:Uncharacterized protein n=1 Tax=Xenorhabdus poinarii G6 TaxID=1354304 RepID=A0A068R6N7_9GAMM|nr:protein of unknown function [Xenorhabdus poinarii G6]